MSKQKYAIGIDLGTSTSEIAIFKNGTTELIPAYDSDKKLIIIPSIVAISLNGEILVGERATSYLKSTERCISEVKRKMGTEEKIKLLNKTYSPQEISAFILKKLKEYGERFIGEKIKDIVLSVPANFSDSARKATQDAAKIAGLNLLYIINEPTAAALAYGIDKLEIDEKLLVFDFGGGTLDITILHMVQGIIDVKYSAGNPKLGGKDIDELFRTFILNQFLNKKNIDKNKIDLDQDGLQRLKIEAEKSKKILSFENHIDIFIPNLFKFNNELIDLEVSIKRKDFEKVIKPVLDEAYNLLEDSMKQSGTTASQIKQVLLVGGSTYIPAVKNLISSYFNKKLNFASLNPDEAVARGAAIKAADKKGLFDNETGLLPLDVCARTLGVSILSIINNQAFTVIDPLILKNTKIPYSTTRDFSLVHPEQKLVEIKIYQGDGVTEEECEFVCAGKIDNIPKSKNDDPHKLIIEFSYNINTIAEIKATIPATNQSLIFSEDKSENRLTDEEIIVAKERVADEWKNNTNSDKYSPMINSAEKLLNKIPENSDNYKKLNNAVVHLKKSIVSNNDKLIIKYENQLVDLVIDFQTMY